MLTSTTRSFGSPSRYIQGYGELDYLEEYTKDYGRSVLAIIDSFFYASLSKKLRHLFKDTDSTITSVLFGGETTISELDRLTAIAREAHYDAVVGIGGGKTIDAAKYTGISIDAAIVIAPTSASTDAPTSALSVTYTNEGIHDKTIYFKRNPDLILADSQIISKAPVRLLVSGMGDALSTYFEARAHQESNTANRIGKGYRTTLAGMSISKLCYETLLADGLKAKLSAEAGVCSDALENIIEANTLLSGLAVECVGCAAAHSLNSGFSAIEACRHYTHGEIGLPVTLEEIGLSSKADSELRLVAERAAEAKHIIAEPVTINPEILYHAILSADAIGRYFKNKHI
ncbi:MAG: glycerol dehydrogenase [Eubacterium sp.]